MIAVALARTVRCNKTRACGEHRGALQRANTTHSATRGAEGVQKWRALAIYPPKPTVGCSVSACFAVRYNGAGEHDDLVIAVDGYSMNSHPSPRLRPLQLLHRPQHPLPHRAAVRVALIEQSPCDVGTQKER